MKLILTQEVTGLGAPGDVVEVKDGYGRNYLVPRGVAIRWTRGAEKTVESIKAARTARAVRDLDHAERDQGQARGRAGRRQGPRRRGRPPVRRRHRRRHRRGAGRGPGEEVDKRTIVVGNPIKSLGAHEVSVRLHTRTSRDRGVNVVPA